MLMVVYFNVFQIMTPRTEIGIVTGTKTRNGTEDIVLDQEIAESVHVPEAETNDHDLEVVTNIAVKDRHLEKRNQNQEEERHHYTGMSLPRDLSTFHHFSIKPCKVL